LLSRIVTNANGLGLMAADSLDEHCGELAQLTEETLATLSAAVQLLAARAQDSAIEPRRVDLQGAHRAGKAA
jgi:acyl-CoA synthetase (NDP forming)